MNAKHLCTFPKKRLTRCH